MVLGCTYCSVRGFRAMFSGAVAQCKLARETRLSPFRTSVAKMGISVIRPVVIIDDAAVPNLLNAECRCRLQSILQ